MFNTTHTFVGIAIARAGADKIARNALATAVIASNFPDVDSIAGFWGTAAYLDHHRGITHSLIGVPIFALAVAGLMFLFSEKFWRTYAIAVIAMASHPALDYLNSYGVRPFLPWSDRWFYGDAVFIFDPYLDVILFLGILAGSLWPHRKQLAAVGSLAIALSYIGTMVQLHKLAESRVASIVEQTRGVENWAVLPQAFRPLYWEAMIEDENQIAKFPIHLLKHVDSAPEFRQIKSLSASEFIARAATSRSAATLLRFARFPVSRVERTSSGYRVTIMDFRFYREGTNTVLASEVILDESLRVRRDRLSFVQPIK